LPPSPGELAPTNPPLRYGREVTAAGTTVFGTLADSSSLSEIKNSVPAPAPLTRCPDESLGLEHPPGASHYRAYVGPPRDYDLVAAMSFGLLTVLGMRQQHRVLDIGCGSLRVGRLLIPYLNRAGYTGLEPNAWLVADGIQREVGQDQVDIKQPRFVHADNAGALADEGARFDFVLAQSILSHCGPDLLDRWIGESAHVLADDGALVATFIEDDVDNARGGWIYPDCVAYRRETLERIASSHGLEAVMLDWRHPRQQWVLMARPGFGAAGFDGGPLGWSQAFDRIDARGAR
jgi:SAM-dependent methyltransferase